MKPEEKLVYLRKEKGLTREVRDTNRDFRDECERIEVERRFSLAKRKCGMGKVTAKLKETAEHVSAMSIRALNLRKIQCAFFELLAFLLTILHESKHTLLFSRH